jgi:predicted O-methyltransferase YrrM
MKSIQGWFNFLDIYDQAVGEAKDGSHFVEVGAWFGVSTSYMGRKIQESGKNIRFDVIDVWNAEQPDASLFRIVKEHNGDILFDFIQNMHDTGVLQVINPIRLNSSVACRLYNPETLDFVFIDADHSYQGVKTDITNFYPLIKKGGVIAGHDYHLESVSCAVRDTIGKDNVACKLDSWWCRK